MQSNGQEGAEPNPESKNAAEIASFDSIKEFFIQTNSTTNNRSQVICQFYKLVKTDPQARRFIAALLADLDLQEASA